MSFISIPVEPLLVVTAKYFYDRIPSSAIKDKYPEKLKKTVEKARNIITKDLYEELTLYRGESQIFSISKDFVIKGSSKVDMFYDALSGVVIFYHASNSEGAICHTTFSLEARVTNAKKWRKIIKMNKLAMIHVPKKYYCSYPKEVLPRFTYCFNQRYFVLAERCAVENTGKATKEALAALSEAEKKQLGRELVIFSKHAGPIDFHGGNFYFKDKKLVFFDTEPMCLTFFHRYFCISTSLKEARVNYENVRRIFHEVPELKIIVDKCEKAKKKIRAQEYTIACNFLIRTITTVGLFVLGLTSLNVA